MQRLLLIAVLAAASVSVPAPTAAQIVAHPQIIEGTTRFTNSAPAVLALLAPPGQMGMTSLVAFASSVPPAPALTATASMPAGGRISSPFQITVESSPIGYPYAVSTRASMGDGLADYWFRPQIAPPVTPAGGRANLDLAECAGVIRFRFVDDSGAPVAISGGSIRAFNPPESSSSSPQAMRRFIPAGAMETTLIVRGGEPATFDTTVRLGNRSDDDRVQFRSETNLFVICDEFQTVDIVVPRIGTLSKMAGRFDLAGEFELTVDGLDALDYGDYSSVVADQGPFGNKRYATISGTNFSAPASGSFVLRNLLPDRAEEGSAGYSVFAQAFFRTHYRFAAFSSPALGAGSNPPVSIELGTSIGLSNLFEINPGYLRGNILLKGPPEEGGSHSMLRGLLRAADGDLDDDGIPDAAGSSGVYWSAVSAVGVDRRAAGAQFTAARGMSTAGFEGAFNPTNATFAGDYELVLGGLLGEPSIWRQQTLSLTFGGGSPAEGNYYYNALAVTDQNPIDREIIPGQSSSNEVACCFGEVLVQIRSTGGRFHSPQIRFSTGTYSGPDFLGREVSYQTYVDAAFGAPYDAASPTNSGYVRLLLPQGRYTLNAYVVPEGTTNALTQINRLDVEVGCGQTVHLEQCLQLTLDAPSCVDSIQPELRGQVRSCTDVERITYQIDGNPEISLCTNCGPNPSFTFSPTLPPNLCTGTVLTVTAYDADGTTRAVTTSMRHDDTPPEIEFPEDIVVACAGGENSARVNFTANVIDSCPGPVTVICDPPSGSVFPVGTTGITCTARDACGNTNWCTFNVSVKGPELSIERAVVLRWTCGVLQSADRPEGPFADVPEAASPYVVPSDQARKFYRVRP